MNATLSTLSVPRAGATPLGAAQCVIASAKNRSARAPMRSASSRSSSRNDGQRATIGYVDGSAVILEPGSPELDRLVLIASEALHL